MKKTRENKPVMVDGKEEWISRSLVVVPFVYRIYNNELYFLTEKRGEAVSHAGEYCGPCGFLDYGEDLNEACTREIKEETGLDLEPNSFDFVDINSKPDGRAENVTVRFINFEYCDELPELSLDNVITKGEVTELFWKKIGAVKRRSLLKVDSKIYLSTELINELQWAFDHDKLISHILQTCKYKLDIEIVEKCPTQDVEIPIKDGIYDCYWSGYNLHFSFTNISVRTDIGIRGGISGLFVFENGKFIEKEHYDEYKDFVNSRLGAMFSRKPLPWHSYTIMTKE